MTMTTSGEQNPTRPDDAHPGECLGGLTYPPGANRLPKLDGARTLDGGTLRVVRVYREVAVSRRNMGGIACKEVGADE
ncbi:hypothetical protein [Falsiroseomonas sp. CW058]|uniref:hypothetical protein n=1 Tax=Falsiroseomonas sp. CW058 TaxID=3388664 RepID=UPI003D31593F